MLLNWKRHGQDGWVNRPCAGGKILTQVHDIFSQGLYHSINV